MVATLVDKVIAAPGGTDKLTNINVVNWKSKTTITFGDSPSDLAAETSIQGLDHSRQTFTRSFNGSPASGGMLLVGPDRPPGWG
jgi:hypothetical protein